MRSGRSASFSNSVALAVVFVSALAARPAAVGQAAAADGTAPAAAKATCVFTHPAFSGKCTENVDVAENSSADTACSLILDCLNDVRCTKTYCSATSLRGGWKLETASPKATP
ncbi:MAG: hypothetical protein IPL90_03225 [Holophagales bacterium]|nr:hypothetical protein [Holophagales bacterium]